MFLGGPLVTAAIANTVGCGRHRRRCRCSEKHIIYYYVPMWCHDAHLLRALGSVPLRQPIAKQRHVVLTVIGFGDPGHDTVLHHEDTQRPRCKGLFEWIVELGVVDHTVHPRVLATHVVLVKKLLRDLDAVAYRAWLADTDGCLRVPSRRYRPLVCGVGFFDVNHLPIRCARYSRKGIRGIWHHEVGVDCGQDGTKWGSGIAACDND